QDGGYIGEVRANGGIYFDTGNPTWEALTNGLSDSQTQNLPWRANEAFLRQQMENRVSRIEYILPEGFDSIDQVARVRRETFSALEINYLNQNAATFGYKRVGNTWIYEGG
ncbi:MAG: endonuclease, partial [Isosphaeraceae bacterium]